MVDSPRAIPNPKLLFRLSAADMVGGAAADTVSVTEAVWVGLPAVGAAVTVITL